MGLFDFFNRNKKENETKEISDRLVNLMCETLFSNDRRFLKRSINELSEELSLNPSKTISVVYHLWMFTSFPANADNRTLDDMVGYIVSKYPEIEKDKATRIARFLVRRQLLSLENGPSEDIVESVLDSLGYGTEGLSCDKIPNGYGEFGTSDTNPVPVNGIASNEKYLSRLTSRKGKKIRWERKGSMFSSLFSKDIDIYEVKDEDGEELKDIYICPYYGKMSDLAPEGYIIDGKTPIISNVFGFDNPKNLMTDSELHKKISNAIAKAGYHIQRYFEIQDIPSNEWCWIQTDLPEPYAQHLCFRLYDNVYSVLIEFVGDGNYIDYKDIEKQIDFCDSNGMTACVIPLDMESYVPKVDGLHLISTKTREIIIPKKGQSDSILSLWELENMAIQHVIKDIRSMSGCNIINYTNIKKEYPHITFSNKVGTICRVSIGLYIDKKMILEADKNLGSAFKDDKCIIAEVCIKSAIEGEKLSNKIYFSERSNLRFNIIGYIDVSSESFKEKESLFNDVLKSQFQKAVGRPSETKRPFEVVDVDQEQQETHVNIVEWKDAREFLNNNVFCFFADYLDKLPKFWLKDGKYYTKDGANYIPSFLWLKEISVYNRNLLFSVENIFFNQKKEISNEQKLAIIKKVCAVNYNIQDNLRDDVFKKISAYTEFIRTLKPECDKITLKKLEDEKTVMGYLYDKHPDTLRIKSLAGYSIADIAEIVMRDFLFFRFDKVKYESTLAELHIGNNPYDYEKALQWEREHPNVRLRIVGGDDSFYSELEKIYEQYEGDLYLPDYLHLHRIRPMAIEFCDKLTSVDMPDSIREIGGGNFFSCNNIVNIDLPEKLSEINSRCFVGCNNLKSVLIRGDVRSISDWCFVSCPCLDSIEVTRNNQYFYNDGDFILSYKNNELYFAANRMLRVARIPEGITEIGDSAFCSCENLTDVYLPGSVTSLGKNAFKNCVRLKAIHCDFEKITSIGKEAFAGCEKLVKFTFGNNLLSLDCDILRGCKSISEVIIPNSVFSIKGHALWGLGIRELFIHDKVKIIEPRVLPYCKNLQKITVDDMNRYYCSIDGVLYYMYEPILHTFPSGRTGEYETIEDISIIEEYAFEGCSLTKVRLSEGIEEIRDFAFVGSENLREVSIPETVVSIGRDIFMECDNLIAVTIFAVTPPEIDNFGFELPTNVTLYVPTKSKDAYRNHPIWSKFPYIDVLGNERNDYFDELEYNKYNSSLKYVEPDYGWDSVYNEVLSAAIKNAKQIIDDYFSDNQLLDETFKWLETKMNNPYFQHLCFCYQGNVFSVLIEIIDSELGCLIHKEDIKKQIKICKANNLKHCIMPVLLSTGRSFIKNQLPLIDSRTRLAIIIEEREYSKLGRWELEHLAVNHVCNYIQEKGGNII